MNRFDRRHVLKGSLAGGLMLAAGPIMAQERASIEAGARKEGRVNLATSVSVAAFPKFLEAFSKKYPFIDINGGLYQGATGTVLARVDAEMKAGAPNFDVLHAANQAFYLTYARTGMLQPYTSPELAAYPADAHDRDLWTTVRAVGVMIGYNKNILSPDKAPKSWADLLKPEFKDKKLVIQNSASGTTFNQIYQLEKLLGVDYMKKLGAQNVIITSGSAQQVDMLIRGEALIAAGVDHTAIFQDDTIKAGIIGVAPTEGLPIAAVPIAILKGAPNPNAARILIDYFLSKEGQEVFVNDVMRNYSVRKDVPAVPGMPPYAGTKPLVPTDYAEYEKAAGEAVDHYNLYFKQT